MKKTTIFKVLGLLLLIIVASCSKEEFDSSNGKSNLKSFKAAAVQTDCQDFSFQLIGGRDIEVGMVNFSWDESKTYLSVCFDAEPGWIIQEVHFYIGTLEGIPDNPQGVPVPGHFPYSATGINASSYCYPDIAFADLEKPDCPVILVHVVVVNGDRNETAWALGCKTFQDALGIKRWGFLDDCHCFGDCEDLLTFKSVYYPEGADGTNWTCLDFTNAGSLRPFPGSAGWCSSLGLVEPEDGALYYLYSYEGLIGEAILEITATEIIITVDLYDNRQLVGTYAFYGTQQELLNDFDYDVNGCPEFDDFPYQDLTAGNTQEVHIPL